ncbi:MAG: nitroreductase family protein [Lachnospiraceae bacterium]|nr:nitroreductase family protein [Lachnospiraceae bacterium]
MLYDLVVKNRSYRGYDHSVKLTRQQLERYVEHARLCPSSVNRQPFKYFLACDEETVAVIQAQTGWARALPQMKLPHPGKEPAAFIVICQDDTLDANLNRYQRDVGAVAQTMLLAAVEEGLGGIMIGNFAAGEVAKVLHLPENIHPLLIVAFGKPDEKIVLTGVGEDGDTNYYRDENDVHYVPKRALEEELLN